MEPSNQGLVHHNGTRDEDSVPSKSRSNLYSEKIARSSPLIFPSAVLVALFSTRRILSLLVALGSGFADHVALGQCRLPSPCPPGPSVPRLGQRGALFVAPVCAHWARPRHDVGRNEAME